MESRVIHGEAIEEMRKMADESVDLCLTDPPYNIGKADWDTWNNRNIKGSYRVWFLEWVKEVERVLKKNGTFYFFHSDMKQMSELMADIQKETKFIFNSFIVCDKGDWRANAWKNPSDKNNLRCWFNTCEYVASYTFQDETGLTTVMLDTNNFPTLRGYFKGVLEYIGLNLKRINVRLGHRKAEHAFYWKTTQWDMPTTETYDELIVAFGLREWGGFREYESLRSEYESLRYVHNLDAKHNNVFRFTSPNGKVHPTQKPLDIIERLILCSSNLGGIILDPFLGSGTTAIAAKKLGRNFIGVESSEEYVKIAQARLS